jgi:hypothetical protein
MTINANALVNVTPAVVAPGGSNLVMNGLMLTANTRIPIGTVLSFPNQTAVGAYFGTAAPEYTYAGTYFGGYTNSFKKPAALLMAQVPYTAAVSAFLRGASVTGASALTTITNIASGSLNIAIDGATFNPTTINLTSATSYSGVATILQTALRAAAPVVATVTGAIAGTMLTVSAVTSGVLAIGQVLSGTGITAGTTITALVSGTGGVGTYTVTPSQTASSTTISVSPGAPSVVYDSISSAFVITSGTTGTGSTIAFPVGTGAVATYCGLTATGGGVLSQGAAIATGTAIPAALTAIYEVNRNWGGFMTAFEPSTADKVTFSAWVSGQPNWYAMWDTITAAAAASATDTSSAYYLIKQAGYIGIHAVYLDPNAAAFALGVGASINYNARNGRETWAYLQSASLTPPVTNDTTAANLLANGYNFYGAYANAGNGFTMYQNGSISGNFAWLDSYTNQIWLNNNIQTSLIQLLQGIGSIPYNPAGYALIKTALYSGAAPGVGNQPQSGQAAGPIAQAINFGAIRAGVVLSANEVAEVNNAAGIAIDGYLNTNGWYLQVLDPGATVRLARGSPIVNLWYMDGQSVQTINVSSVDVQ